MDNLDSLVQALKKEKAIVYTGAGVSTNSGIPDFRGENGFYKTYHEEDLAIDAFFRDTDLFYKAFQEKFKNVFTAKPNDTHKILAELEEADYLAGIITQNVDQLHQAAGSKNVVEFHGDIFTYDLIQILDKQSNSYRIIQNDIPYHTIHDHMQINYRISNSRVMKPQVVLFGEGIKEYGRSMELSLNYNLHIIMGTSYQVTPFNMLSYENRNHHLKVFVINNEPITYHAMNHAELHQIIGDTSVILKELKKRLEL